MSGSSFGRVFVVTTAGESHGPANVVIVDGCPAGISLSAEDLEHDLARRRPGQSALVSQRREPDRAEILSGVFEGTTTGTPIAVIVQNVDQRERDYAQIRQLYRPGHADHSYEAKYGVRDYRGGGRASARETVSRVIAGAIAKKILARLFGARVFAYVRSVGDVIASVDEPSAVDPETIERFADGSSNPVRCPDHDAARKMIAKIDEVRRARDSIGGLAEIVATDVVAGLGEPVFDKLKADLAKALFSLPAVLGVEYGVGFGAATMRGSENNDLYVPTDASALPGGLRTASNRHGGMLGGISTGMPIILRAVVKPTSSIAQPQPTVNRAGEAATIATEGRHDPCLLPRFVPMAEAMVAIVLADHALRARAVAPIA